MNKKCQFCGDLADYQCGDCEAWMCDNCADHTFISNKLQRSLCKDCADTEKSSLYENLERLEKEKEQLEIEREEERKKARDRYRRPENVERRRIRRLRLLKERREWFERIHEILFRGL